MKINNPNGIIEIIFDGFLSCLRIDKPRVADWPNCDGTVDRYFSCFPPSRINRELLEALRENINKIKTINDFIESGFTKLLVTGEYEFETRENVEAQYLYNTSLINSNETIFNWRKEAIGNYGHPKPYSPDSFYPDESQLLFTEPFESFSINRIKYYENQISNGERPKAIVIRLLNRKQLVEDRGQHLVNTVKYVLDGHHKLIAYKNKNIHPHYIVINKIPEPNTTINTSSALPMLYTLLYPYQQEHIINWGIYSLKDRSEEYTKYIDRYLQETSRIDENLISQINLIATTYNSRYHTIDLEKREWFEIRLRKFKQRIEENNSKLIFTYHCKQELKRKHLKVNTWDDIYEILLLQKL